jgi:putative transposase
MKLTYQYKLLPKTGQETVMQTWLDMLRAQYNYMLTERFDWWESNRCPINACPLHQNVVQLKDNPDYFSQKKSLPQLKKDRPWYKQIHSQVLQEVSKQVKTTFDRFIKR